MTAWWRLHAEASTLPFFVLHRPGTDCRKVGASQMPDTAPFPDRHDPYRQFRFLLWWDGRCVAGFSQASTLARSFGLGQVSASITLERGLSLDPGFTMWLERGPITAMAPDDEGAWANLELVTTDAFGQPVQQFDLQRARVIDREVVGDPAEGPGRVIALLTLAYERMAVTAPPAELRP